MRIGMNLEAVADFTAGCPYIDRMLMGRAPSAVATGVPIAPFDPSTGLPLVAGKLGRAIPIDPATTDNPHTYVLLCDENVAQVATPWATMKPVNGRATIKITSASTGVGLGITATGPVKKFAFMRAEHEAAYLAGDIFNPEYIASIAPFPVLRPLDYNATNYEPAVGITSFPPRRPLPTDGYFSTDRGGLPAEHIAMLAKKTGAEVWYPLHHLMADNVIEEIAKVFLAAGVRMNFEYSNEFGWTYHKAWALAQAAAHSATSTPTYLDVLRFYGWRSANIAKIVSGISPDFRVNLASQASNGTSNLPPILKGWDETGAPRSLIAGYANGSYINPMGSPGAVIALMKADDKEGFYTLLESEAAKLQARHVKAIAACKAAGVPYKIYEGNILFDTEKMLFGKIAGLAAADIDTTRAALLAWAAPLINSDRAADIVVKMYQDVFAAGAVEACHFQHTGKPSQYGGWGTRPHVTQAPYPIYDRLVALNAKDKADPLMDLAAEVVAMQKQLASLAGRIAAVIVG